MICPLITAAKDDSLPVTRPEADGDIDGSLAFAGGSPVIVQSVVSRYRPWSMKFRWGRRGQYALSRIARWTAILVGTLGAPTMLTAQEGELYSDHAGRFTIPVPGGWLDRSTQDLAHFVDPQGEADLYAVAVEAADAQMGIAGVVRQLFDGLDAAPLQTSDVPLPNELTWTQNLYRVGDDLIIALGHARDGEVYTLVARGEQAALARINPIFLATLLAYVPTAIEVRGYTPPSYADRSTFTERDVVVRSAGRALPGTLTRPRGAGPFPAAVLVHGSGPNDRNSEIIFNRPFQDIAWGLASRGIAVLRYDKRTFVYGAESSSDPYEFTVQEEVIDDAVTAIRLPQGEDRIDATRVFVVGHSLGATLAPRIAHQARDLAGVVMLAGTSRSLAVVSLEQLAFVASLPENRSDESTAAISQMRDEVQLIQTLDGQSEREQMLFGAPVAYWLDLQAYDQVEAARSLEIPMLILQGEADYQVTMVDFRRWQEGLASERNATFKSYPNLYHLFMRGEGLPADYNEAANVDPAVVGDIAAWLLMQL